MFPGKREIIILAKNEIPPESITVFVTWQCLYEENWWLAGVLEVCSDTNEVKQADVSASTWYITFIQISRAPECPQHTYG